MNRNHPSERPNSQSRFVVRVIIATICILSASAGTSFAQETQAAAQDVRRLKPGHPIVRELKCGDVHNYRIRVRRGRFTHVVVDQRGIEVTLTLLSPTKEKMFIARNSLGDWGLGEFSFIAEKSGDYQLLVEPLNADAPLGQYEIKMPKPRKPRPEDYDRIDAERLTWDAWEHAWGDDVEKNQRARESYRRAAVLWEDIGDDYEEAEALSMLGNTELALGDNRDALSAYDHALSLWRSLGEQRQSLWLLSAIGTAAARAGENQRGLTALEESSRLHREQGDQHGEASALGELGMVYGQLGDNEKALALYDQSLNLYRKLSDDSNQALILYRMGTLSSKIGQDEKALELLGQSLSLRQKCDQKPWQADTLVSIAEVHKKLGETQLALDRYRQASDLYRTLGYQNAEAATLKIIATLQGTSIPSPQK